MEDAIPELPSKSGRNSSLIPEVNSSLYLLKETRVPQFRKSIPVFISKVKEFTSLIEDQFLPLLDGNSGIASLMLEVNSSL